MISGKSFFIRHSYFPENGRTLREKDEFKPAFKTESFVALIAVFKLNDHSTYFV